MAIGDTTAYPTGDTIAIELLASATAANSPPSGSSAGLAVSDIVALFNYAPDDVTLLLFSTAGSATMTVTARLWGYHPIGAGYWCPLGTGADADKGKINAGAAIGETGADTIRHSEVISLVGIAGTRIYLEITNIGGTSTAVEAHLVVRRR